jgi:Ni,Fe-hydrogenase III large subunit
VSRDLAVFVVPDARLTRAAGLDLAGAGLLAAATPRHASVLLLIGPIPDGLATAAAVSYAQMPRPRSILAIGAAAMPGVPAPDVVTPLDQTALQVGVAELGGRVSAGAFSPSAAAFDLAVAATRTEYVCPMHPEIVREEPERCPICGMDLVPREAAEAPDDAAHHHAGMAGNVAPDARLGNPHDSAFTCPMHPEVEQSSPGRCPICGMHLEPVDHTYTQHGREQGDAPAVGQGDHGAPGTPASNAAHELPTPSHAAPAVFAAHEHEHEHGHEMEHGRMDHGAAGHHASAHPSPRPGTPGNGEAREHASAVDREDGASGAHGNHAAMDHGADHAAMEPAAAAHDMMDHSGHATDFMSMVAMTRDLPRSADGLPMEWIDVPFGPLFPGLPGGLNLSLTLDGDGVAGARATADATARGLDATWPGPAESFPQRLERLDPLAPVAYRLLAGRALEEVAGVDVASAIARARIREAEWERVGSHLGWLAEFGFLIGDRWLAQHAAALQIATATASARGEIPGALIGRIRRFVARVPRMPLLERRLAGIGQTTSSDRDQMRGPVARAAGMVTDARLDDPAYAALGFAPVTADGGDAFARLDVRLEEISTSLDLVLAAGSDREVADEGPLPASLSGATETAIETPRGAARLHLAVDHGAVVTAHLDPPSSGHMALVPDITAGAEVADALVAVASLDLSPWEVSR